MSEMRFGVAASHSYLPAPSACVMGDGHAHVPPVTLLTSKGPAHLQSVDKAHDEESLLEEKSEKSEKGPSDDYVIFGIDAKPFLHVAFALTTVMGAICMLLVQIPMCSRLIGVSQAWLLSVFGAIYGVIFGCMVYCTFCDPGRVKKVVDIEEGLPRRAHRSWLYGEPILRYDHYCKWLKNVIGLRNHREFVVMVAGLVLIGLLGIVMDTWLVVLMAEKGTLKSGIIVALHASYLFALLAHVWPIFKIHCGLISRNELAHEWKEKEYYVANNTSMGDNVPVDDLQDDEYNLLFDQDAFVYDRTRNPFDNGCFSNCFNFWCKPRWTPDAKGDF